MTLYSVMYDCKNKVVDIHFCMTAMTINKSQGKSLKHIRVYLSQHVFSHGHLHVAISRVTSRKDLKILIVDDEGLDSNFKSNVVYKEVF